MRVMTKADSLGMFASRRMKFDRYQTSETTFRTYDETAIVTGRLRRTRVIAGAMADDDWRFTKVYLRRAGRWQMVSFHASNTNPSTSTHLGDLPSRELDSGAYFRGETVGDRSNRRFAGRWTRFATWKPRFRPQTILR